MSLNLDALMAQHATPTDVSGLPADATFTVSDDLDASGEVYTTAELGQLIDHHVDMGIWDTAPTALRLLSDGRVIDEAWDPNSGAPTVLAQEIS